MRQLVQLQDEVEVAYSRMVSVTVDPPEVISAFRAGLGARWTILSDADRVWLERLDLEEKTDPASRPYVPTTATLHPDLTIHRIYGGYWFWGRPTLEDLRQDMRAISRAIRSDFDYRGGAPKGG
jgi:hypothetical protein